MCQVTSEAQSYWGQTQPFSQSEQRAAFYPPVLSAATSPAARGTRGLITLLSPLQIGRVSAFACKGKDPWAVSVFSPFPAFSEACRPPSFPPAPRWPPAPTHPPQSSVTGLPAPHRSEHVLGHSWWQPRVPETGHVENVCSHTGSKRQQFEYSGRENGKAGEESAGVRTTQSL